MIALLLTACVPTTPQPIPDDQPVPTVPTPPEPGTQPVVGVDPGGQVVLPTGAEATRDMRRMDIDQLDASIRVATGGIGWDIDEENQFEVLASSLGVPDYIQRTTEDLSTGLLFQKFLDDAAQDVCHTLVEREFEGTSSVLLRGVSPDATRDSNAYDIDAALSAAVLRFHGRSVPVGAPQLDDWTYLFDTTVTVTGGDTMAAWRAVCIGLIVHPDFYQY